MPGSSGCTAHQADALARIRAGDDVVVVTATASGKSLCYEIPVLQSLAEDPSARALFLFPTKALGQDQVAALRGLASASGLDVQASTYDGDTPAPIRSATRTAGQVVVTNPDMLHAAILPHHTKWYRLFEQLRYIVVDELHTYRGVFGSHVANVLRRLLRICAHYGSHPVIVCCSATIANPVALASALTGRSPVLVDRDGSPAGDRHVLFVEPPLLDAGTGARGSALTLASRWAQPFLRAGRQTIVFGRSRTAVEILLTAVRDGLREGDGSLPGPARRVRGYRGGYLPTERRSIERGLRDGEVLGVVATNALELGVDIGGLDVAVLAGYPGSIAATRQQMGRAGRRLGTSVAVLVASGSAVDRYVLGHPEFVLDGDPEEARLDPDNLHVLLAHLKAAAFELPFEPGEAFGPEPADDLLAFLAEDGHVRQAGDGRWYWASENFPASAVSLRSAAEENVVIIDTTGEAPRVIGEVDLFAARTLVHEDAIYLHESVQFHVDRLDWDERKAYVRRVDVDHYTQADLAVTLKPLDVFADEAAPGGRRNHGEVMVASLATIYKKLKFGTNENIGWGRIHLPEIELQTTAYWLTVDGTDAWRRDELDVALVGAGRGDAGGRLGAPHGGPTRPRARDAGAGAARGRPRHPPLRARARRGRPRGAPLREARGAPRRRRRPHRPLHVRRRVPRLHRPAPRVRRDGPRPPRPRPPAPCAPGRARALARPRGRMSGLPMRGLPPPTAGGRPQPANDTAARASAIAAAVPGVTLGRRLASFRVARAADRPGSRVHGRPGRPRASARRGGRRLRPPGRGRHRRADRRGDRRACRWTGSASGACPGSRPRMGGSSAWTRRRRASAPARARSRGSWASGHGRTMPSASSSCSCRTTRTSRRSSTPSPARSAPARVLVTYNGRSFDWPLLVARYRLHRRPAPVLGGHLDLLPVVRRLFRHRLGGARLRTVEESLLGVTRHDDVEGWEIPALYLDFLRGGAATPLALVARHNAEDIRSLGRLLGHLDARLADPSARRAAHPGDLASLAEMLRLDGRHDEALACLEHAVAALHSAGSPATAATTARPSLRAGATGRLRGREEPTWWSPRVRADAGGRVPDPDRVPPTGRPGRGGPVEIADVLAARARTLRRLGRHADAADAWEDLAMVAGPAGAAAWIEVAKIREHAGRDPVEALAATDRALALLARRRAAGRPDVAAEGRAARRRARLVRRVARARSIIRTARA